MSDARPSAAVAVRGSLKLVLAVCLVALCLAPVAALVGAPAPARADQPQASTRVCGPARTLAQSRPPKATASKIGPLAAVEWLGARAGTALAEKGFLTALEAIMRKAGHRNPAERTLEQLGEIRGHLNEVSVQLGRIEGRLDGIATVIHNQAFDNVLRPLCGIARAQESLFDELYEPMFRSGYRLTLILDGDDPADADKPGPSGESPREEFEALRRVFMERAKVREDAGDFQTLHDALMPGSLTTSVLRAYGNVLLSRRMLNREDSDRLRLLYRELAEVRAVATWMSEEFWGGEGAAFNHLVERRRRAQIQDTDAEERNLPPVIPWGVVIDVGSGATGTGGKPMWYPGADRDIKWLPPTIVGPRNEQVIRNNEVDEKLEFINNPYWSPGSSPGPGWTVPTRRQFEALISTGCVADRTDPNRFEQSVRCTNAVTPASGGTVAGYLYRLNPGNTRWEDLFCTGAHCPSWAGPRKATHRNLFVWTRDIHTHNTFCGEEQHFFTLYTWRRQMNTYTGYRTLTDRPEWGAFPALTGPTTHGKNASEALAVCDAWFRNQLAHSPGNGVETSGVLLATRYSGAWDRNPVNNLDYMAQP